MASMDNQESTLVLLKRVDYLGIVTLVCGTLDFMTIIDRNTDDQYCFVPSGLGFNKSSDCPPLALYSIRRNLPVQ